VSRMRETHVHGMSTRAAVVDVEGEKLQSAHLVGRPLEEDMADQDDEESGRVED
jgi:hypothetical protein